MHFDEIFWVFLGAFLTLLHQKSHFSINFGHISNQISFILSHISNPFLIISTELYYWIQMRGLVTRRGARATLLLLVARRRHWQWPRQRGAERREPRGRLWPLCEERLGIVRVHRLPRRHLGNHFWRLCAFFLKEWRKVEKSKEKVTKTVKKEQK